MELHTSQPERVAPILRSLGQAKYLWTSDTQFSVTSKDLLVRLHSKVPSKF